MEIFNFGVGDLAQWQSACLASARPCVRSPAPKKRKKKKIYNFHTRMAASVERSDDLKRRRTYLQLIYLFRGKYHNM